MKNYQFEMMVKYFLYNLVFLIQLIIITNYVSSQSLNWQRVYQGPSSNFNYFGEGVCQADGFNYFLLLRDYADMNRAVVYKINSHGDSLLSYKSTNRTGYACITYNNGSMVFTGESIKPYTTRIGDDCGLIWDSVYNLIQTNESYYEIYRTKDNKILLLGAGSLIKLGPTGELKWQKNYPGIFRKNYLSVAESVDLCYVLSGESVDGIGLPSLGVITKIDTAGNLKWEKKYKLNGDNGGIRLMKTISLNNRYLACGYYFDSTYQKNILAILKLDLSGNILDTLKYISTASNNCYFSDVKLLTENRIVVLYYDYNLQMDTTLSSALIIDTAGNINRNQKYANTSYTRLKNIYIDNNNSLLFIGVSNHLNSSRLYPYVVKTDSMLYAPPVDVSNFIQTIPEVFYLKQNYPNPFNATTSIIFGIRKINVYKLAIFDITGKLVKAIFNNSFNPGEYRIDIRVDNLSSGIYFYRLESVDAIIAKKFVILK